MRKAQWVGTFLDHRNNKPSIYQNSIIDGGSPTSTGGVIEAATICDELGIKFKLSRRKDTYQHI